MTDEIIRVDNSKLHDLISKLITCGFRGSAQDVADRHIGDYLKDRAPSPNSRIAEILQEMEKEMFEQRRMERHYTAARLCDYLAKLRDAI